MKRLLILVLLMPGWAAAQVTLEFWTISLAPLFNGYEKYVAELYPDEPRTLQRPLQQGQKAR